MNTPTTLLFLMTQNSHRSTLIPDRCGDKLNILNLFLGVNLSAYSVKLFFLLSSFDHSLIPVFWPIGPIRPLDPQKIRCFRYFGLARWNKDVFFLISRTINIPSRPGTPLCVCITSRRWLPLGWKHTFNTPILCFPHDKEPWFNHSCFLLFKQRENLKTLDNHSLYILAGNRAKYILWFTKKKNFYQ